MTEIFPPAPQPEQPIEGPYDHMLSPHDFTPQTSAGRTALAELAAVRPERPNMDNAATDTVQQMNIDAADRVNREQAGLAPRAFDLR